MSNFVPWRPAAWALLHERTGLLRDRCVSVAELDGTPSAVADAAQRVGAITDKLAGHLSR